MSKPTIKKSFNSDDNFTTFVIKVPIEAWATTMWLKNISSKNKEDYEVINYSKLQPLITPEIKDIKDREFETLAALAFLFEYYSSLDNS